MHICWKESNGEEALGPSFFDPRRCLLHSDKVLGRIMGNTGIVYRDIFVLAAVSGVSIEEALLTEEFSERTVHLRSDEERITLHGVVPVETTFRITVYQKKAEIGFRDRHGRFWLEEETPQQLRSYFSNE